MWGSPIFWKRSLGSTQPAQVYRALVCVMLWAITVQAESVPSDTPSVKIDLEKAESLLASRGSLDRLRAFYAPYHNQRVVVEGVYQLGNHHRSIRPVSAPSDSRRDGLIWVEFMKPSTEQSFPGGLRGGQVVRLSGVLESDPALPVGTGYGYLKAYAARLHVDHVEVLKSTTPDTEMHLAFLVASVTETAPSQALEQHLKELNLSGEGSLGCLGEAVIMTPSEELATRIKKLVGSDPSREATALDRAAMMYGNINIGMDDSDAQRFVAEGEMLFRNALAIREKHFGSNHPETALSLAPLAFLYYRSGRKREAGPFVQRLLSMKEEDLPVSWELADTLGFLESMYQTDGDPESERLKSLRRTVQEKAYQKDLNQ